MSFFCLLFFMGTKFSELYQKQSVKEILTFQKDVILNPGHLVLNKKNFEVAASLNGGDLQFDANFGEYLKIVFFQYNFVFDSGDFFQDHKRIAGEPCGKEGFTISEERNQAIRLDLFDCPKKFNEFLVSGQFTSLEMEFFGVAVQACEVVGDDENCETDPEKWKEFIKDKAVTVAWKNRYFDFDEFEENPVKEIIVQQYHGMIYGLSTNSILKTKEVKVETQNSWFGLFGTESYVFYEIQHDYYHLVDYIPELDSYDTLYGAWFTEDEKY